MVTATGMALAASAKVTEANVNAATRQSVCHMASIRYLHADIGVLQSRSVVDHKCFRPTSVYVGMFARHVECCALDHGKVHSTCNRAGALRPSSARSPSRCTASHSGNANA